MPHPLLANLAAVPGRPAHLLIPLVQYCDRGSLADAIRMKRFVNKATGAPNMKAILSVLLQVAQGMSYLASQGVIHADLKAANVLLKTAEGGQSLISVKIADFGLSRMMGEEATAQTQTLGTISYMPPELISSGRLGGSCVDVWSFGVLMWECLVSDFAYKGQPAATVFFNVVHEVSAAEYRQHS